MVDVKEAAKRAADYFSNIYSDKPYSDLLLEEVELSEDGRYWLITLSYASELSTIRVPSALDPFPKVINGPRKYKLFKIDAATGNVKAMKIRSLN
jgi:hypothetical protein